MKRRKEINEIYYKLAVRMLDLMLKNEIITSDEYKKIDALNRNEFSPELYEIYI